MAGSSSSNSTGSSSSSSTPSVIQTPQSQWALQLSQLLGALTQNQYQWAMGQFQKGSQVTDDQINNYMALAGQGAGLAQNLLGRYENVFEPIMNQYIQQAGSYNSSDRQKFMMGQAESTAGQADKAAQDEAERRLQSFGINPNSGRYQDLMLTSRMQDAATRAGAGTQASVNTAAIGRDMTRNAAQMGQNVPGMTVNALQSAYTGVTGAENAILGLLNTGANLTNSAANFGNAAANANKLPPVGNTSVGSSQQRSNSGSNTQDPNQNGKQNQSGGRQPTNQGGAGRDPGNAAISQGNGQDRSVVKHVGQDDGNGEYGTEGGLNIGGATPGMLPDWLNNPGSTDLSGRPDDPLGNTTSPDNTNWAPPNSNPDTGQVLPMGTGQGPGTSQGGVQSNDFFRPSNNGASPFDNPQGQNPPAWGGGGQSNYGGNQGGNYGGVGSEAGGFQPGAGSDFQEQGGNYGGQGGNYGGVGSEASGFQPGAGSDYQSPAGQYQGGEPQGGNYSSQGGGNYQGGQYTPPEQSGFQGGDSSDSGGYFPQSGSSGGGYSGYGSGYAQGGKVRSRGVIPTSGGPVPRGASPSRGRVTDDIPARLNAGEFVIPRDVTAHMGTKHFQDVIAKSRKIRTGMAGPPPGPKMRPGLPQRPNFISHPLGQR